MYTMLRKYRKEAGISQAELATFVGASPYMIETWETNHRQMSASQAEVCAELFGCDARDIVLIDSDNNVVGNKIDPMQSRTAKKKGRVWD